MTIKTWEVMTGKCVLTIKLPGPVHTVAFAEGDRRFACANDPFGQEVSTAVYIFDFNLEEPSQSSTVPRVGPLPITALSASGSRIKVTRVGWLPLNEGVLASLDTGGLRRYDAERGVLVDEWKEHEGSISSFSFNATKTLLITSSHDRTAKLWDAKIMKVLRTFTADVPLNAACISPIREHVLVGGGQEAMSVTTTASSAGKFETRFHHMIFENELGRVKGHFGPINALAMHPDGQSYVSGAEDGYMRLHRFDPDYFSLGDEDNLDDPILSAAMRDGTYEQLETEEAERLAKEASEQAAIKAATG
jgi:translation initiation factor 3 subunit I